MEQLMQKLMMSKAIMDRSDQIKKTGSFPISENLSVQNFDAPEARYNIPSDILQETQAAPKQNLKTKVPTTDAIKNSKLPDEIKRLMIERPIIQPQQSTGTILSDELVEKASRLMRENSNNYTPESAKPMTKSTSSNQNVDYNMLKKIVKEVVEESLRENGLISESSEKTNEIFSFKVGKHIFEGKVTKIKKLS
jgi:hypothetical protein